MAQAILLYGILAFLGWGIGHVVHRACRILPQFET